MNVAMGVTATAGLVREGVLDAELAGLLWLLLDARTPVVVVAPAPAAPDRDRVMDALAGLLPDGAGTAEVAPDDDFEWLREAVELGWRRDRRTKPVRATIGSGDGVLVARGLASEGGVDGERARIVVRALALGYGLLATMDGSGLDEALDALHDPSVGTDDDERSRLGVVLVLGEAGARLEAAHYVRPTALDPHGHVQREPPAVLAAWNERAGTWDHFAWGLTAELGQRTGRAPLDLEREQARRATTIAEAARPDV